MVLRFSICILSKCRFLCDSDWWIWRWTSCLVGQLFFSFLLFFLIHLITSPRLQRLRTAQWTLMTLLQWLPIRASYLKESCWVGVNNCGEPRLWVSKSFDSTVVNFLVDSEERDHVSGSTFVKPISVSFVHLRLDNGQSILWFLWTNQRGRDFVNLQDVAVCRQSGLCQWQDW